jgi:signal transduction histidine kinase
VAIDPKTLERRNANVQRRIADLEAAHERDGHRLATVSHELRRPLTSILGFAMLSLDHWDELSDQEIHQAFEVIARQADGLNRLVATLQTMSLSEAGYLNPVPCVVEVHSALVEAVRGLPPGNDGIVIEEHPSTKVRVDPDHFQQIISNLLANALVYGERPIRIKVTPEDDWVDVSVCDMGQGVPDNFLPDLFTAFRQAEQRGQHVGTGLGLSICRALADANGGELWYEHNEPRGACFIVRLPRPRSVPGP